MNKILLLAKVLNNIGFEKEANIIKLSASKVFALQKLGFSPKFSKILNDACHGLSMWVAHLMLKDMTKIMREKTDPKTKTIEPSEEKKIAIKNVELRYNSLYSEAVSEIMDWVKVGLNGAYHQYKDMTIGELHALSKDWIASLESEGSINYKEEGKILIDYRDSNGLGYYWVMPHSENGYCSEEARRMGHCGKTRALNKFISLRNYYEYGSGYTMNKSLITVSIDPDGNITQIKGPHNSKPSQEYEEYIFDLYNLNLTDDQGLQNKLIKGIDWEYDSDDDFKLSDFSYENIIKLMQENPGLFSSLVSSIELYLITKKKGRAVISPMLHKKYEIKIGNGEHLGLEDFFVSSRTRRSYPDVDVGEIINSYLLNSDIFYDIDNSIDDLLGYLNSSSEEMILSYINKETGQEPAFNSIKDFVRNARSSREENNYSEILFELTSNLNSIVSNTIEDSFRSCMIKSIANNLYADNVKFDYELEAFTAEFSPMDILNAIDSDEIDKVLSIISDFSDNNSDVTDSFERFIKELYDEDIIEKDYLDLRCDDDLNYHDFNEAVIESSFFD
jgi:hypothetical protein